MEAKKSLLVLNARAKEAQEQEQEPKRRCEDKKKERDSYGNAIKNMPFTITVY